jgi:hypothetical protein
MPNAKQRDRVDRIFADGRQIDRALKSAVDDAIRDHARRNAPVVVWRNGRAALVPVGELTRSAISAKRTISPKRKAAKKRRAR